MGIRITADMEASRVMVDMGDTVVMATMTTMATVQAMNTVSVYISIAPLKIDLFSRESPY